MSDQDCPICGLPNDAARVRQLLAAGDVLFDTIIWMSGSPSFDPAGEAGEEWLRRRDKVIEARALFESARL